MFLMIYFFWNRIELIRFESFSCQPIVIIMSNRLAFAILDMLYRYIQELKEQKYQTKRSPRSPMFPTIITNIPQYYLTCSRHPEDHKYGPEVNLLQVQTLWVELTDEQMTELHSHARATDFCKVQSSSSRSSYLSVSYWHNGKHYPHRHNPPPPRKIWKNRFHKMLI